MSLRQKMKTAKEQGRVYEKAHHPTVGHAAIRSLTEYERSCFENSAVKAGPAKKGDKAARDQWMITLRAKLVMMTLCEPEMLYDEEGKETGPNPDYGKLVYNVKLEKGTNQVSFDNGDLNEILNTNGAIIAAFADPAMKHVGMSSQDMEELLGNSERIDTDVSQ